MSIDVGVEVEIGRALGATQKDFLVDVVDPHRSRNFLAVFRHSMDHQDKEVQQYNRDWTKRLTGFDDRDVASGIVLINESEAEGRKFHLRDLYISATGKIVEFPHYFYDEKGILQYSLPEGKKIKRLELDDYIYTKD